MVRFGSVVPCQVSSSDRNLTFAIVVEDQRLSEQLNDSGTESATLQLIDSTMPSQSRQTSMFVENRINRRCRHGACTMHKDILFWFQIVDAVIIVLMQYY